MLIFRHLNKISLILDKVINHLFAVIYSSGLDMINVVNVVEKRMKYGK